MDEQAEVEPRHLGLFVRPLLEIIEEGCLDAKWDHRACLMYKAARWPVPLEGSDLDMHNGPWTSGGGAE